MPVLTLTVTVYLVLVAVVSGVAAAGVRCGRAAATGAVVAELLLVLHAGVDLVALLRGGRPADLATHLGYVVVSVALLPVLLGRLPDRGLEAADRIRVRQAVQALVCLVVAVVVVRQHQTLA